MKSIITILTICLLTLTGTQTAQAQTKEKTKTESKTCRQIYLLLNKSHNFYSADVSNSCLIRWEVFDEYDYLIKYSLNPSAAKWYVGDNGHSVKADKKVIKRDIDDGYDIDTDYTNSFEIGTLEDNLAGQMADALNHLATFCDK